MKRLLVLLLAFMMLFLTACQSNGGSGGRSSRDEEDDEDEKEIVERDEVTAENYYRYLNEVFLAENKLVTTVPIEIIMPDDKTYVRGLDECAGNGLASAFIEDFDGDSILEMLTVEVLGRAVQNTFYNRVMFDDGAAYDPDERCIIFFLRHFCWEDGEIVENADGTIAVMPDGTWGKMVIGLEKVEDEYFIFAHVNGENMSTYGPRQFTLSSLGGNALQPIYTSVLNFGRADASNYAELMGISNDIDIDEYSISDLEIPNYTSEIAEFRESLGTRLLCVVDIDYVEWGGDDLIVTIQDYTALHENLENNGRDWEPILLPEGYRKEVPDAASELYAFMARLENATGVAFTESSVSIEDGLCEAYFDSETGNSLILRWDEEKNALAGVILTGYREQPDDEWYALKDAILQQPELGLDAEQQAVLAGKPRNWTDYMNGIVLGDYTFHLFAVTNAVFNAFLNE